MQLDPYSLIHASYACQALYVLTKHDVFDALIRGPKSTEEIASISGLQTDQAEQLLSAAAALGYLRKIEDGFRNEKKALVLTRASRSWVRSYLLLWGEQLNPAFNHLESWATNRTNPFQAAHGAKLWDFYRADSAANQRFVDFQDLVTDQVHTPLISARLDVGDAKTMVDVGGGKGSLTCAVLKRHAAMTGVVYDQPHMQTVAMERISRAHIVDRCRFVSGSMLESVPHDHDLYVIKHVLHDWPDRSAMQILENIRAAMSSGSRLIVVEGILDHACPDADMLHTRNLEQVTWTNGKVRTLAEFGALTRAANLRIANVTHTEISDLSFIECLPT